MNDLYFLFSLITLLSLSIIAVLSYALLVMSRQVSARPADIETVVIHVKIHESRKDIESTIRRMGRIGFGFSASVDTYGRTVGLIFQRRRRTKRPENMYGRVVSSLFQRRRRALAPVTA